MYTICVVLTDIRIHCDDKHAQYIRSVLQIFVSTVIINMYNICVVSTDLLIQRDYKHVQYMCGINRSCYTM